MPAARILTVLLLFTYGLPLQAQRPPGAIEAARTPRFVFYATPEAKGVAEALAGEAEALRERIAADLGRDYPGVTEVRVAHDGRSFRRFHPDGARVPTWAAGVAWPEANLVVLDARGGPGGGHPDRILAHEVSHLALGRLGTDRFPRWFLEGMATYHAGEFDLGRAATLASAVTGDGIIPLSDLSRGWPEDPAAVQVAYAQSIEFVGWLFRDHGPASVARLIEAVLAGASFDAALEAATGTPLWRLEDAWHDDLSLRYTWLPALTSTGLVWGLTSLLFLSAWWRRRRHNAHRLRRLEAEDEALAALPPRPPGQAPGAPSPAPSAPVLANVIPFPGGHRTGGSAHLN